MPLRARLALPALAALAALALAGCSPTSGGGSATPTGAASASPTSGADATASAPATDAAASENPAAASESNCLVGDWVLTDDQMQLFYDQVNVDLAEYAIVYDPTGSSGLTFRDDGTYAYTPDLSLSVDIAGLPAEATLGGTLSGEYAVDGDTVRTSNDTNELSMDVTVDGVAMDGTAVTEEILASPITAAPYDCSGDTPVIHFSTGASSVPLTLARG
ncbi:hypothetical protein BJ978_000700 [Agromyces terreus]|uniref:Uncharacterized protein n=1 Tax=Agromyces terreus TaxID=424795 RepID=A0A9X2H4R2_9MICO|nr:hypothetical protein [Agromyces terreus]MCP2370024.1 hypothetical protein [Agromyces terreus]